MSSASTPIPADEPVWPCDPVETVFARTAESTLTESDWRDAIQRIMAGTDEVKEAEFAARREAGAQRYFQKAPCMLRTQTDDGEVGIHLVTTRNLSRGGLSVLHAMPLTSGTRCVLALQAPTGPGAVMEATVGWCREVDRDDTDAPEAYEVGLQFDGALDVTAFLEQR